MSSTPHQASNAPSSKIATESQHKQIISTQLQLAQQHQRQHIPTRTDVLLQQYNSRSSDQHGGKLRLQPSITLQEHQIHPNSDGTSLLKHRRISQEKFQLNLLNQATSTQQLSQVAPQQQLSQIAPQQQLSQVAPQQQLSQVAPQQQVSQQQFSQVAPQQKFSQTAPPQQYRQAAQQFSQTLQQQAQPNQHVQQQQHRTKDLPEDQTDHRLQQHKYTNEKGIHTHSTKVEGYHAEGRAQQTQFQQHQQHTTSQLQHFQTCYQQPAQPPGMLAYQVPQQHSNSFFTPQQPQFVQQVVGQQQQVLHQAPNQQMSSTQATSHQYVPSNVQNMPALVYCGSQQQPVPYGTGNNSSVVLLQPPGYSTNQLPQNHHVPHQVLQGATGQSMTPLQVTNPVVIQSHQPIMNIFPPGYDTGATVPQFGQNTRGLSETEETPVASETRRVGGEGGSRVKYLCRYQGCRKHAKGKGMCIAHGGGKRCVREGCMKIARFAGSICHDHHKKRLRENEAKTAALGTTTAHKPLESKTQAGNLQPNSAA